MKNVPFSKTGEKRGDVPIQIELVLWEQMRPFKIFFNIIFRELANMNIVASTEIVSIFLFTDRPIYMSNN